MSRAGGVGKAMRRSAPTTTSSIRLLEHVNLNVPDRRKAYEFYVNRLGGAVHPNGTLQSQLHVNFGVCQFHLPFAKPVDSGACAVPATDLSVEGVDAVPVVVDEFYGAAQLWDGIIELWVAQGGLSKIEEGEDVCVCASEDEARRVAWRALEARKRGDVEKARACLSDEAREKTSLGGESLVILCPFGNVFVLRSASEHVAEELRELGTHPGNPDTPQSRVIGIAHVHIIAKPGSAKEARAFYDALGATTTLSSEDRSLDVVTGKYQVFSIHDDERAVDHDACETNARAWAYHVCMYVNDEDIDAVRAKIGSAYHNSVRFKVLDSLCAPFQVRARAIAPRFYLEHEIRTLQAPMCPLNV
uniref:VOC domain-containing protein n=1 Tax=Pycnococcus provasolii TaxID=41880 RepID=A0A7S2BKH3_9CHLO|mmetsp:Transcript_9910/g.22463  ORF Transcript_9910/g.22463 Transcript_9910/m.22463 type:complete len:359 (+) Transcript_9910:20-1096(+)